MIYKNIYELRVWGIRRSGNHAVSNWLCNLFNDPVHLFNNCKIRENSLEGGVFGQGRRRDSILDDIICKRDPYRGKTRQEVLDVENKECLLYSFESKDMRYTNIMKYDLGPSKYRYDIIIMRDFYNLLASSLNIGGRDPLSILDEYKDNKDADEISYSTWKKWNKFLIDYYIIYAKEFLGETNYLTFPKICISYNDWFKSVEYREKIATKLNLKNRDRTINIVAAVGNKPGSFDGFDYDGNTKDMKVLERWKLFKDNSIYQSFVDRGEEAIELSNRIFGKIEGT